MAVSLSRMDVPYWSHWTVRFTKVALETAFKSTPTMSFAETAVVHPVSAVE